VKRYLRIKLGGQRHESFVVLFVDVKNRLIADRELFRGTLTQTNVLHLRNNVSVISA
jgi:DNA repair protein RadC